MAILVLNKVQVFDQKIALPRAVPKKCAHFFQGADIDLASFRLRARTLALGIGRGVGPGDHCCHSEEMKGLSKMYNGPKDILR